MALMCYQSTPVDAKLPSLGNMLYARMLCSNLPLTDHSHDDAMVDHLEKHPAAKKQVHSTPSIKKSPLMKNQL